MRLVLRLLATAVLLVILAMAGLVWDVVFNQRRVMYTLLGRDGLVAACRPPLGEKLRALGFEPSDIEFGDDPDISVSSFAGKTLSGSFTFADGATQARVDGVVTCSIEGGRVTVEVSTDATPRRAASVAAPGPARIDRQDRPA